MRECNMCEGEGELMVSLHPEHGPKTRRCPECFGKGRVSDGHADYEGTPADLEEAYYDAYMEQKWEADNDR